MISVRRSSERGHAHYGWLDARYSFSFANYLDLEHMGFGTLRVLNQDRVEPGRGFPRHSHENMEIVTCVLRGELEHKDSMGNGSRILPGEFQYMSAGTGVTHSEYNASSEQELELLQMWILPAENGTPPRYEQRAFSEQERQNQLRLVVSPIGEDGALTIGQDARLYSCLLEPGHSVTHTFEPGRMAWLHVASGKLELGDLRLESGDGAAIRAESAITLTGCETATLVLWDLPVD
jgi:redox-sensitive bicupin YhaK (pirin superfamily)